MNYKQLGKSNIQISAIIFGGWQSGKSQWIGIDDQDTIRAHQAALDHGITTFDTAEAYGEGHSEQILGAALKGRRNEIVILDKVWTAHLRAELLVEACERSLQKLQTDYIDLYQIHWPSGTFGTPRIPIAETMSALVNLKETGKIRAIGVSNFSPIQLKEAMQYGSIDSLQPPYSLFWRQAEKDLVPFCAQHGISVLAYSSLAQGLLTGKFDRNFSFPKEDIRSANKLFHGELFQHTQDALDQLRPIAKRNSITLSQLALAWLVAQPQVCPIVGARNADQAIQNAAAGDVILSTADLAEVDRIGRTVTDLLDSDPVMWSWS